MKILYLWVLANSGCGRLLHLLHGDVLAIGGRRGRRLLYQQGTTDQQSSKHQRHRRRLTHGVRPDLLLSGDRSVEAWFCVLVGPQDSKYRRDSPATPSAGGAIAGIPASHDASTAEVYCSRRPRTGLGASSRGSAHSPPYALAGRATARRHRRYSNRGRRAQRSRTHQ